MKSKKLRRLIPITKAVCVGGALIGSTVAALPQDATTPDDAAKIKELSDKVDSLTDLLKAAGITPSSTNHVSVMSDINVSGFVTASYFYDTSRPSDRAPVGYLWNRTSGAFTLNKFKLTVDKPVEVQGDNWDAGFRASLIYGQDAPYVNTGGNNQGFDELREAYAELNVPIGTGLDIKAGQLISLLNYESGDGGAANPNFSQGYQWWFTGNGPSTGIQASYNFTDKVGATLRVQNRMFAAYDTSYAKTVMGAIDIKPTKDIWVNFLGFGGKDTPGDDLVGGSILAGYQITSQLGTGFEFDDFKFNPKGQSSDNVWSLGGWIWYNFTPKVGLAFRGDYIEDPDGYDLGGTPLALDNVPFNQRGDLYSLTLTLDYTPLPNVKIQPEIRFDGTSYANGFGTSDTQVIVGLGASYLF